MVRLNQSVLISLLPVCLLSSAAIIPALKDRETACIALGDCPGENPPAAASTTLAAASTTPAAASTTLDAASTTPAPSLYCTNPSLEDGDGICTCNEGTFTTTITPVGGPGNACPTTLTGVSIAAPTTATPEPSATAQSIPIVKGYVAFGDSYAAGIGTGTTETGGCRKGSYSYPRQLAAMAVGDIDFQNLPCSGAIVGEVLQGGDKSQIDAWTNPSNADIATLSIGGNDIGFYPILTACVLRVGQSFAGDCDAAIQSAYNKINGRDLFNDIASALNQMIDKSGRDDFKVYMTGYPAFFNVDTKTCDYSTFYYWQPGHHGFHHLGNWAYLYQALRLQINNLVTALNTMLSQVADSVNAQYPSQRVWFVDPNPAYDGHRFCETDAGTEVTEPDASRADTWLFLSGWGDNNLPGTESSQDADDQQLNAISAGNDTNLGNAASLPDPSTCGATNAAAGDNDWYDLMACEAAMAVANMTTGNYSGPSYAQQVFQQDQAAIAAGNFSAVEVDWYVPTSSAKTFHPRTLGQQAYKIAIMNVW